VSESPKTFLTVFLEPPPDFLGSFNVIETFGLVSAQSAILKASVLMADRVDIYVPPGTDFPYLHPQVPYKMADHRSEAPPRFRRECLEVASLIKHAAGKPFGAIFDDRLFLASQSPDAFLARWPPALENPDLDVASIARLLRSKGAPPSVLVEVSSDGRRRRPALADWLASPLDRLLDADELARLPAPVTGAWSIQDLLALAQLAATPPGNAMLDRRSSEILASAAEWGWSRNPGLGPSDGVAALSVAPAYVLRVLPGLAHYPAELVLEWRAALADSLSAFRQRVGDFSEAFEPVDSPNRARRQLEIIGAQLDRDYSDLVREARATRLWRSTREQAPTIAGRAAAVGVSFGTASGNPAVGLVALLSATLAQGVTMAFDLLRRRHSMREHQLHWRYVIGNTAHEQDISWHRLAGGSDPRSRARAWFVLNDLPPILVPNTASAAEQDALRLSLDAWPSQAEWEELRPLVHGLTNEQVGVLVFFAHQTRRAANPECPVAAAISMPADEFAAKSDQLEERGMIIASADPDFPEHVIATLSRLGIIGARMFTATGEPPQYLLEDAASLRAQAHEVAWLEDVVPADAFRELDSTSGKLTSSNTLKPPE
jgi:hypothetical protein